MSKLRHIAMSVPDPWKAAEFYQRAFGMTKVGETDSSLARGVYLSDGVVNLALLNYKTDAAAGEDRGRDFVGLHHVGFWVEDVGEARRQIEEAGGEYFMGEVPVKSNIFYEVKFRDPNGVVLDITAAGWGGASKDGTGQDDGPKLRHEGLKADRTDL
ncbi:MAG: VOC family protein [Acidobacteriota bacterium]|nr:VOC family protein [Acidobacteriota bacterium]